MATSTTDDDLFAEVRTLEDIDRYILDGYRSISHSRYFRSEFGFQQGRLSLSVACPGPLIVHAVELAGEKERLPDRRGHVRAQIVLRSA